MAKPLDEADVGISCYISSLPGFRGVLKQRYSDFIVNEVGLDGEVVRLAFLDPPPEDEAEKLEEKTPPSSDRNYTEAIESFRSLASDADAESLREFLEKISSSAEENDVSLIVLSPDPEKSHRAEVHNFFKKNFKFLVTDTVEGLEGDSKCVRVRYCSGQGGGRGRRGKKRKDTADSGGKDCRPYDSRGSDNWPEHRGKFLRFHLYKENKDTQEALGVIGKMLGIQQRSFGFAGTKDKRSISTQRVTIFKQHAKRLAALNSRLIGIKVGDFCYVNEGLVLGQLLGNRFTITLRGVVAGSEDIVKVAADSLGRNGFINYYGLQRFGSGSVPTHLIGAALLRGEWKTAIGLILDPREGERALISEARQHYKDMGDVDVALRQFPRHLVAERAILQCLKKCPGNYLQALKAIPRTLRMMYAHSYQSYLWNHAATMRVEKHGINQVILGDLVYSKEGSPGKLAVVEKNNTEDDTEDSYTDSSSSEMPDAIPEEKVQSVKTINSEDLLNKGYTFEDVVLPLPGSRVQYPENDIAGIYHHMAKKDGISLTECVHGVKEFSITSMTGGYRRVFQRPLDFVWELLTYTDSNMPLAETDLDLISKTRPADVIENDLINGSSNNHMEISKSEMSLDNIVTSQDGCGRTSQLGSACSSDTRAPKVALKLGFTLPASCYATMAIRELLKTSTSAIKIIKAGFLISMGFLMICQTEHKEKQPFGWEPGSRTSLTDNVVQHESFISGIKEGIFHPSPGANYHIFPNDECLHVPATVSIITLGTIFKPIGAM